MEKWKGKVAVVTGASSGIGAAIARELVHHGMTVVGLARRDDRIKSLFKEQTNEAGKIIAIKTDLRIENEVVAAFEFVEKELGGADVLVNNAGVAETEKFIEGKPEKWKEILEVNVLAVCVCTKLFLKSAKRRNLKQGHIINISSVLGHMVNSGRAAVYQASKHAVTALSKSLRRELAEEESTIKVTSVSPGFTRSEIVAGTKTELIVNSEPILEGKDVAGTIVMALSASAVTQVCEVVLTPIPGKKLVY